MNTSFKLGKVSIPVDKETGAAMEIEGIEISMENFDVREYMSALRQLPGFLRDLKQVFEEDSAVGKVEEVEDEEDELSKILGASPFGIKAIKVKKGSALEHMLKQQQEKSMGHPLFGGFGSAVKSDAPFKTIQDFINSAMQLKKEQEGNKPVSPLEAFFKGDINLGDLGKNLDKEI